jgi:hypothetical protein
MMVPYLSVKSTTVLSCVKTLGEKNTVNSLKISIVCVHSSMPLVMNYGLVKISKPLPKTL